MRPSRTDILLVCLLAAVALVVSGARVVAAFQGSARAVNVAGPFDRASMSFDKPETLTVQGLKGEVVVEVGSRGARVVSSDCPDQDCVRSGWKTAGGSAIVCAPNGVTVSVTGGRSEYDAVVR